ncbi:FecCD family ABC transporter permease [Ethanoligenens sp.]|uniref:FecCD family ABC transporter permease n=1 Tax=Ethanoligenens sp. TaxID=2099655 RepID=UPI0039E7B24A
MQTDDYAHCEHRRKRKFPAFWILALVLGVVCLTVVSLCLGQFSIWPGDFLWLVQERMGGIVTDAGNVFFNVRLPRVLAALLIGAGLSMAGGAYQGIFNNPMVSPDLLGASSGAAFGAVLGILFSFGTLGTELSAFCMGIVAVAFTYAISQVAGGDGDLVSVLLTGSVVGSLFAAFTATGTYLSDPNSKMPEIAFWLMGGLANVSFGDVCLLLIPFCVGGGILFANRWRLNLLTFGREEAMSLGVNAARVRLGVTVGATLLTASSVAVAGMVGWVGLIIPHLSRALVGPNYKALLPVSALMGAGFLLLVDDVARNVGTTEIPLSVLTAIVGAPFFLLLLSRSIHLRREMD